jgi:hypothetical protein
METAIATGSTCTSADVEPSYVITAMHDEQRAHSGVTDKAVQWIAAEIEGRDSSLRTAIASNLHPA